MSIELIVGCMYSGKTTELMRRIRRRVVAGEKALILKYSHDTRYSRNNLISSHDAETMQAVPVVSVWDALEEAQHAQVIGIDEAQFMGDKLSEFCELLANDGRIVILAALSSDWRRRPFENVSPLYALAESVTKLDAICFSCHQSAAFTRRINAGITQLEDIGGQDKYLACCRKCFTQPIDDEDMSRYKENVERIKLLISR